jgi:tRNA threonylcarbamoyladenosine biosynthesis protein TsaB
MIFYIDTSTSFLYSALYKDGKLVDSIKENLGKELSSKTLSKINEMFNKNSIHFSDISLIIAVNGPGSFTGIRVGLTIAKTMAWALNIPIVPISSLLAMAYSSKEENAFVAPVIDARRGYCYASIYDSFNKAFIMNDGYVSFDALTASLESLPGDFEFITNDEFKTEYRIEKYEPLFENIIENVKDNKPTEAHLVDANYLKKTEAEEKLDDC